MSAVRKLPRWAQWLVGSQLYFLVYALVATSAGLPVTLSYAIAFAVVSALAAALLLAPVWLFVLIYRASAPKGPTS